MLNIDEKELEKIIRTVIEKELKPMFNAFKNFCRQHRVKGI